MATKKSESSSSSSKPKRRRAVSLGGVFGVDKRTRMGKAQWWSPPKTIKKKK